jgi:hypothetical protein
LSLLVDLEEQRRRIMTAAVRRLLRGQPGSALALAGGADALRHDEDSQRLLALCDLLRRDFARAWRRYNARRASGDGR